MFEQSTAGEEPMIVVDGLTKRYGAATVVDGLSFQVRPGRATGELIELVGVADDADRKVGDHSLAMRQRLALARGLLADPAVLIADEPANGLDPEGINWMRALLRELAGRGMTVLLSRHRLSEAERLVDDVIVVARGRLVTHGSLEDLRAVGRHEVVVAADNEEALAVELRRRGLGPTSS